MPKYKLQFKHFKERIYTNRSTLIATLTKIHKHRSALECLIILIVSRAIGGGGELNVRSPFVHNITRTLTVV